METIVHECAQNERIIHVLGVVHENGTESNGFNKFGVEIENSLTRFLVWPILAQGNRMFDENPDVCRS